MSARDYNLMNIFQNVRYVERGVPHFLKAVDENPLPGDH